VVNVENMSQVDMCCVVVNTMLPVVLHLKCNKTHSVLDC